MVADALAGDRLLAVATLRSAEGAAQERGAVYPVAGAGIIEAEERLDDGRFNVLVRGLARVRLAEELLHTGKPYREFRVELLDDVWPPGGPAALAPDVEVLVRCVLELARRATADDGVRDLAEAVARMRVPSRLADAVAAALVSETAERLALLEERDVARRLARVTGDVAALLAAAPGRGGAGPSA
jgi:hypothetical protein